MSAGWIVLMVIGGFAVAALTLGLIVRRLRERKAANLALRDFAIRHDFTYGGRPVPGHNTSDPVLSGEFDGLPLVIDEYTKGGDTGVHLTRWSITSPEPWPGGLVAYTPGFYEARGGPHGKVHDNRDPIYAFWSGVNDREVGDPELDKLLAIDGTDLDTVRSILLAPDVKRAVLSAVQVFKHIRIQGRETAIEIEGPVASLQQLEEGARLVASVARALAAACPERRDNTPPKAGSRPDGSRDPTPMGMN